eukprot:TRINITY_DN20618_c0_g1_i2.p1 TRINITY_DN20618_c0_g1~~TRINITY_DN20618_c0_g1_i2.p1  ORF type:complete len:431 (+),score=71.77 TRINITY_DN20618_c0_g1_i2:57-1349(+)
MGCLRFLKGMVKSFVHGNDDRISLDTDSYYSEPRSLRQQLLDADSVETIEFEEEEEADNLAHAVTLLSAVIVCDSIIHKDRRLLQLKSLHAALKVSHEERRQELSIVKQELTQTLTQNNDILQFLVSKAEEEAGLPANNEGNMQERMRKINQCFQTTKEKETDSRFGSPKQEKPPPPEYTNYAHDKLRGPNKQMYNIPHEKLPSATAKPKFATFHELDPDKLKPDGRGYIVPYYNQPRLSPVGIRPPKGTRHAVKFKNIDRYPIIIKHNSWDDGKINNWEGQKMSAMKEVLGKSDGWPNSWLPGRRLRVEVDRELPLPVVLQNAQVEGYKLWDTDGHQLTVNEQLSEEEEEIPIGTTVVTLRLIDKSTTFTELAMMLKKASWPAASVIPSAPHTYDVVFRDPVPSAMDLKALGVTHGFTILNRSVSDKLY